MNQSNNTTAAQRRANDAARKRARHAQLSEEEREVHRKRSRENLTAYRASLSQEERQQLLEQDRDAHRERRASLSLDEQQQIHDQNAESHRQQRRSESPAAMIQRLSLDAARLRRNSNLSQTELSESGNDSHDVDMPRVELLSPLSGPREEPLSQVSNTGVGLLSPLSGPREEPLSQVSYVGVELLSPLQHRSQASAPQPRQQRQEQHQQWQELQQHGQQQQEQEQEQEQQREQQQEQQQGQQTQQQQQEQEQLEQQQQQDQEQEQQQEQQQDQQEQQQQKVLPVARRPLWFHFSAVHRLKPFTAECSSCGAKHWPEEKTGVAKSTLQNPKFSMCCAAGKVRLPNPVHPPAELEKYLLDQTQGEYSFLPSALFTFT